MDEQNKTGLAELTSEIVAAYVANNSVRPTDMPELIASIHGTLSLLGKVPTPSAEAEPPKPAVPIKKSITEDYIISLEDGRKLKSMKRYLGGIGMTPDEYRAKWGLPKDYPMVAPAYAKQRSSLAKSLGLGRRAAAVDVEPEVAPKPEPDAPKKRSRAKAAA